jgi:hypothetical protein
VRERESVCVCEIGGSGAQDPRMLQPKLLEVRAHTHALTDRPAHGSRERERGARGATYRVGVLHGTVVDAGQRLPKADRSVIARRGQHHRLRVRPMRKRERERVCVCVCVCACVCVCVRRYGEATG